MSDMEIHEEDLREDNIVIEDNIVVSEDSLEEGVLIVEDGEQVREEPIEASGWSSANSFVKWCVVASRRAPQIKADNSSSIKRAIAYYDNMEQELEQGIEADADHADISMEQLGTLDTTVEFIEMVRSQLRLAGAKTHILKQASKAASFTYVVDPFIFAIARLCINAKVSNGKNIEDVYSRLQQKFGLDARETLSVRQVMRDMGYPIHGSLVADEGAFDMITQYFA